MRYGCLASLEGPRVSCKTAGGACLHGLHANVQVPDVSVFLIAPLGDEDEWGVPCVLEALVSLRKIFMFMRRFTFATSTEWHDFSQWRGWGKRVILGCIGTLQSLALSVNGCALAIGIRIGTRD